MTGSKSSGTRAWAHSGASNGTPGRVKELAALMEKYATDGRSTPGPQQKNDVNITWDKRSR
jgi:hypothetical protein